MPELCSANGRAELVEADAPLTAQVNDIRLHSTRNLDVYTNIDAREGIETTVTGEQHGVNVPAVSLTSSTRS